jgi:ribonuclease HII
VLFDYERLTLREVRSLTCLDDSKVHDPETREMLYPLVIKAAVHVAITSRCVRGIDERGLHKTNLAALSECLARVAVPGCICLADGFRVPDCGHDQEAVIEGDARSAAIAAASVLAKVTRDRYMLRMAEEMPGWHFHTNVGYSTPEHRAAIQERGISDLHRRSFQSIAYQQLAIGADPGPEFLEGALDVVELEHTAEGGEAHADHVEAELPCGPAPVDREPHPGHAADLGALGGADGLQRAGGTG